MEAVDVLKPDVQRRGPIFYAWVGFFVAIDFFAKRWFDSILNLNQSVAVIPGWLQWHLIYNKGASFGIFSSYTVLLTVFSFIIIFFIFHYYLNLERKTFPMQMGFALMIGGAVGNLLDRIGLGYVVDFIDFRLWPAIFNVADVELRTGVLILIVLFMKDRKQFVTKQKTILKTL